MLDGVNAVAIDQVSSSISLHISVNVVAIDQVSPSISLHISVNVVAVEQVFPISRPYVLDGVHTITVQISPLPSETLSLCAGGKYRCGTSILQDHVM